MATVLAPQTASHGVPDTNREPHIPLATYRIQLNRSFTFPQARDIVAYLHALGISDLYASPLFKASPESTHGYDIADHNSLNPVLGSPHDFDALVAELAQHGMGLLLDTVPNHMGIGEPSNAWWMDVLENGPASPYAPYFDIDWHPVKREMDNKVLLPILGNQYGQVLEAQELQVRYADGAFLLYYYDHCLPVNPRSYQVILEIQLDTLLTEPGPDDEGVQEYQSIITALNNLPTRIETDALKVAERHREKEIIKRRLQALYANSEATRTAIDTGLQIINGTPGDPRSFDLLNRLIDRQAYRLAYWRVAAEQINYRRFFDVNDLAAIRMEREDVFEATHKLILRLLAEGKVTGLRLDHPDGLYDPAGYFRRLQDAYAEARGQGTADSEQREEPDSSEQVASRQLPAASVRPLYVLAEKILARGESLPAEWPIYGTTGYDFATALTGVLVDTSAERRINEIYTDFTGLKLNFDDLVYDTRKQIMRTSLASELTVLSFALSRVAEHNRYYRDFTLSTLRDVIREVIACFPVYRTYIVATTDQVSDRDQHVIETAVARARRRNPAAETSIYEFLRDILLLRYPGTADEATRDEQHQFVMKFQQVTGPVMAKGLEDTAFYIYNRLTALNEVGGEPRQFGTSLSAFHRQNQERRRDWPHAMIASSTHDTKRSEDVRARITVLSELTEDWRKLLTRLGRLNARKKREVDGKRAPSRNEEYLLYQTILGTLPIEPPEGAQRAAYIERIQTYMIKAIREAKVNTSWLNPNNEYDDALLEFVEATLNDQRFYTLIAPLLHKVAHFGVYNTLAQTLLKLTAPGVPDIYQGNDLFDFSLVDPDNRRPVDYGLRRYLLDELQHAPVALAELAHQVSDPRDSRSKLFLTYRTLGFRRNHAALFQHGDYTALEATGAAASEIIAFSRSHGGETTITVAPRLLAKKLNATMVPLGAAVWADDMLVLPGAAAGQAYTNVLTEEIVVATARDGVVGLPLAAVLANFPVALLEETRRQEDKQTSGQEDL